MISDLQIALLAAGDEDAVSFSDDSSPDSRMTSGHRVSITGQVIRERSLNWYYDLLKYFPDVPGELKSEGVVARFNSMPLRTRDEIWSQLRHVRIHIVDPRPYRDQTENLLRESWRDKHAPVLLQRAVAEGQPWAKQLAKMMAELVAESIVRDSPAARVLEFSRLIRDELIFSEVDLRGTSPIIPVHRFGSANRALVDKATRWAAKSSAVFQPVLDTLNESGGGDPFLPFATERATRMRMLRRMEPTHAFDAGDDQQLRLLEEARQNVLSELTVDGPLFMKPKRGITKVASENSYFIQAADFASGIASNIYTFYGLLGVVSKFEYVTYNGRRVSQAEAEEDRRERMRRK